jgi:hypothetical protein
MHDVTTTTQIAQHQQGQAFAPAPLTVHGSSETAATAAAAHAQASIQARYVMAVARPRNFFKVREELMRECKRSGFAGAAIYELPRGGKKIPGFSIRFAEAARRCFTNIYTETVTVFDDRAKRILRVIVTDLEAGITESKDVTVEKAVERRSVKEGQTVLASRVNSEGQTVHLVAATDDELLQKEGALVAKAKRNLILAMIPGDLLDESWDELMKTRESEVASDPLAAAKKIVDAFASVGVSHSAIEAFLGHGLERVTAKQVLSLRSMYAAIKDGAARWEDYVAEREASTPAAAPAGDAKAAPSVAPAAPSAQPTVDAEALKMEIAKAISAAKSLQELGAIAKRISMAPRSIQEWLKNIYGIRKGELSEAAASNPKEGGEA